MVNKINRVPDIVNVVLTPYQGFRKVPNVVNKVSRAPDMVNVVLTP